MKFKVGDRVRAINDIDPCYGLIGTIKDIEDDGKLFTVVFDEPFLGGHDGDIDAGSCAYYLTENDLQLLAPAVPQLSPTINAEPLGAAEVPTAEAEDNTTDIMDAENPKRRLMAAYEKFEAAIRQQDEACEEIAQIVREMRNK